jgi:hypothetical protein
MTYLQEKNKHIRDSRIIFDENTHTYSIDGIKDKVISVTTLIHNFFPIFNADIVIEKMRKNLPEKYIGMTNEEIKKNWEDKGKEASILGTKLHKLIELYYNNNEYNLDLNQSIELNNSDNPLEFLYFLNFNETIKHRLKPYRTEWSIFRSELKLAGQLDILYEIIDKKGEYALYDWKRIKEIKTENKYEKGIDKLNHLDHCNYNHYSIQLNIYKRILETLYGIKITEMFLVILHPDNDNFKLVEIVEMKKEIDYIFKNRKIFLAKS